MQTYTRGIWEYRLGTIIGECHWVVGRPIILPVPQVVLQDNVRPRTGQDKRLYIVEKLEMFARIYFPSLNNKQDSVVYTFLFLSFLFFRIVVNIAKKGREGVHMNMFKLF